MTDNQPDLRITAAALALKDQIIVGASGGDSGVRDWVAALNPADGKLLWRKYTIPAPGEPGSETWKGNTNAWPIEVLTKGDVYVADCFGKIAQGTLIGDNLGNSIFAKSGNGVIFDAAARDLEGLAEIKGFNAFVRDFDPSYLEEVVLMGLNTPIRIGRAIVLPGDLVISEREGVLFIPAHLAEKVISTSEFIELKDKFGHAMLRAGKYSPGQIDSQWTEEIKTAFLKWLDEHPGLSKLTKAQLDEFMSKRTW